MVDTLDPNLFPTGFFYFFTPIFAANREYPARCLSCTAEDSYHDRGIVLGSDAGRRRRADYLGPLPPSFVFGTPRSGPSQPVLVHGNWAGHEEKKPRFRRHGMWFLPN